MSALEVDLLDLMTDTVTVELAISRDRFSDWEYAAPVACKCYVARQNRLVRNRAGEEVVSTVQVFFADPTLALTPDARLTLADGSVQAIHEVLGGRDDTGDLYWLEARA